MKYTFKVTHMTGKFFLAVGWGLSFSLGKPQWSCVSVTPGMMAIDEGTMESCKAFKDDTLSLLPYYIGQETNPQEHA